MVALMQLYVLLRLGNAASSCSSKMFNISFLVPILQVLYMALK